MPISSHGTKSRAWDRARACCNRGICLHLVAETPLLTRRGEAVTVGGAERQSRSRSGMRAEAGVTRANHLRLCWSVCELCESVSVSCDVTESHRASHPQRSHVTQYKGAMVYWRLCVCCIMPAFCSHKHARARTQTRARTHNLVLFKKEIIKQTIKVEIYSLVTKVN